MMIANTAEHFKYIRANVEHLRKNISDHPELLRIGQEVACLSDLSKKVNASKISIEATSKEIIRLNTELETLKNDPRFKPVDLFTAETSSLNNTRGYKKLFAASVTIFGGILMYRYYKTA